jgi:ribosomal protein S27AE
MAFHARHVETVPPVHLMSDTSVKTIRDLIWFRYAKTMARSSGLSHGQNGTVRKMLDDLRSGARKWVDITNDDSRPDDEEKKCAYCGGTTDLSREHIVSRSLAINEKCPDCDTIQTIHNQVWVCRKCISTKGTLGLYQFYQRRAAGKKKFDDAIPPLLEMKYLKVVYDCLNCAKCLNGGDLDGDGELTVLDIDFALQQKGRLWNVLL